MGISPFSMASHQQIGIHEDSRRGLASISDSESCASPDRGPHLPLTARLSHDLSTSRTMTHPLRVNKYPHPTLDAIWTTEGREVGSTARLDLTCFLIVGELMRNPMKMSDV
jgi:hypothetical protein